MKILLIVIGLIIVFDLGFVFGACWCSRGR